MFGLPVEYEELAQRAATTLRWVQANTGDLGGEARLGVLSQALETFEREHAVPDGVRRTFRERTCGIAVGVTNAPAGAPVAADPRPAAERLEAEWPDLREDARAVIAGRLRPLLGSGPGTVTVAEVLELLAVAQQACEAREATDREKRMSAVESLPTEAASLSLAIAGLLSLAEFCEAGWSAVPSLAMRFGRDEAPAPLVDRFRAAVRPEADPAELRELLEALRVLRAFVGQMLSQAFSVAQEFSKELSLLTQSADLLSKNGKPSAQAVSRAVDQYKRIAERYGSSRFADEYEQRIISRVRRELEDWLSATS